MNIRGWQTHFLNGEYEKADAKTQISAGWYDWFCKDTSLANKTKKLGNIIKKVKDGGKVNLDKWYVWFKNNCPMCYPLYDDFRFSDIESRDVMFTICIDDKSMQYKYNVYGRKPDGTQHFSSPMFSCDKQIDLVKWLNTAWEN